MSEFRKVDHPDRSPTSCVFCGEIEGPFIHTEMEIPAHGWLFICCGDGRRRPGCLGQMARLAGYMTPDEARKLEAEKEALREEMEILAVERDEALEAKPLSREEMVELLEGTK